MAHEQTQILRVICEAILVIKEKMEKSKEEEKEVKAEPQIFQPYIIETVENKNEVKDEASVSFGNLFDEIETLHEL